VSALDEARALCASVDGDWSVEPHGDSYRVVDGAVVVADGICCADCATFIARAKVLLPALVQQLDRAADPVTP
jgi:hypothetical protein